jgi:hypothetical protein
MRLAFAASALCLSVLMIAVKPAASQTPAPSTTTPVSSTAVDAAAKHARRTACLQETKGRKLVGAEKTAFLKECIGAPPEARSANRILPPDRP